MLACPERSRRMWVWKEVEEVPLSAAAIELKCLMCLSSTPQGCTGGGIGALVTIAVVMLVTKFRLINQLRAAQVIGLHYVISHRIQEVHATVMAIHAQVIVINLVDNQHQLP